MKSRWARLADRANGRRVTGGAIRRPGRRGQVSATDSRISAGVDAQGAVTSGYQLSIKGDGVTFSNSQLAADKVAVKADNALRQDEQSAIKADSELTLHGKDIALSGAADAQHIRLEAQTLTAAGSARLQAKDSAVVRAAEQGDWQGNLTAEKT